MTVEDVCFRVILTENDLITFVKLINRALDDNDSGYRAASEYDVMKWEQLKKQMEDLLRYEKESYIPL